VRLGPGEGRVLSLELSEGRHRLRSPSLPRVVELDVSAAHGFSRADLVVGTRFVAESTGQQDARLRLDSAEPSVALCTGRQTLGLRNELDREVSVRVERTADRGDALTAAQAWAMPKFRELFPGETLESGRLVSLGELSFLVLRVVDHRDLIQRRGDAGALAATLRAFDPMQVIAERHHGQLAGSTMDVRVATFERAADAIAAARETWRELCAPSAAADGTDAVERADCSLVVHRGSAVATTIDERMAYYGATLSLSLSLSSEAAPGELVLSSAALADDETVPASLGGTQSVRPAPALGPSAWCLRTSR
jgi:hypothetical protein